MPQAALRNLARRDLATTSSQLDRDDYTVGWICATTVELAVSQGARSTRHLLRSP